MQKPVFVMVYGCVDVHDIGDLHMCDGTIDVEVCIGIL